MGETKLRWEKKNTKVSCAKDTRGQFRHFDPLSADKNKKKQNCESPPLIISIIDKPFTHVFPLSTKPETQRTLKPSLLVLLLLLLLRSVPSGSPPQPWRNTITSMTSSTNYGIILRRPL